MIRSTLLYLVFAAVPTVASLHKALDLTALPEPSDGPSLWTPADIESVRPESYTSRAALRPDGMGLMAGTLGTLWRPEDGGVTWSAIPSPLQASRAVGLHEGGTGLIADQSGAVWRTPAAEKRGTRFDHPSITRLLGHSPSESPASLSQPSGRSSRRGFGGSTGVLMPSRPGIQSRLPNASTLPPPSHPPRPG